MTSMATFIDTYSHSAQTTHLVVRHLGHSRPVYGMLSLLSAFSPLHESQFYVLYQLPVYLRTAEFK